MRSSIFWLSGLKMPALAVMAALLGLSVAAHAERKLIIYESFDGVNDGAMPSGVQPNPVGTLNSWRGNDPQNWLGNVFVTSDQFSGSAGKSVCFTDSSPKFGDAPSIVGAWTTPASNGFVKVEWKFMVPEKDVTSLTFLGGTWGKAAAVLIIGDGELKVHHAGGDNARAILLKNYELNKWYTVRFDFNIKAKTFNCYLNGELVLRDYKFASGGDTVNMFEMKGDMSTAVRNDAPVLYVDDVYVATAAKPDELNQP